MTNPAFNKHILVVEDDEGIQEMLRLTLEFEGFKVSSASNGQEGLTKLEQGPLPDMILLDLMMPVMNGWEFAEAMSKKASFDSIPILIVSAYKTQSIKSIGYLQKPISSDELLSILTEYFSKGL